jgi:hypothetical protein
MTYDPYAQPSQPQVPPPGMQPPPGMPMAPQYQAQQQAGVELNSKAVAAVVCGIIFCTSPLGIMALAFGKTAERQINAGMGIGRPLAKAGRILGWVAVGFTIFWAIYLVVVIIAITTTATAINSTY